ncbi:MAG: hypothetical protein ABIF85_05235 [Nanoarchaeota archaeon]|nr:hypothetical protein [Nanoarchaeota archaeon]MBU4300749.1 hypothetical protein [Nanoarchaeota archaeon]MBU4452383.1 hypothetical protein [Nanoarchaeota archaeon]MCG2723343.1 hypothetical protein [archaeon]
MAEEKTFNWGLYERLFKYFEKNSISSLSEISRRLNISISKLYEPLHRIESEHIVEKIFPTPGCEVYFKKLEKNS